MERASRALSGGMKMSTRRSKRVKAGAEGKEGKALDGVEKKEGSGATNSLKQRVEQDDKAYNKMGTETAASTRKEAGPKETMVGSLDKDKNNGQRVDDKEKDEAEEDEAVEEEESVGKECGVADRTTVQDSTLGQFLAKVEDALKPIAIFALSKTAFPARQVSRSRTFFMFYC